LSRDEALAHPWLPDFWEAVDFVLLTDACRRRSGLAPTRYDAGEVADDEREHDADRKVGRGVASSTHRSVEQLVANATSDHK
jgi:hypothetical protein